MKRIFKIMTLVSLMGMFACNEAKQNNEGEANEDSKEQAEEANEEKFDDDMEKDADWVANVVAANYGEIKFAGLANERSANPEVKQIATMLVTDHTKTLNELKAFAQGKTISVPVEEDDEARRKTERFSDEAGKDFDKKWCKEMIDRHEESIKKFERRAEKTEDADLKAWINKTLPHLRMHLEKLEACHEKIKDSNS